MLGVIFYQLLINKIPFDMKSLSGKNPLIDDNHEIDF